MHITRFHNSLSVTPKGVEAVLYNQGGVVQRTENGATKIWNAVSIAPEEG